MKVQIKFKILSSVEGYNHWLLKIVYIKSRSLTGFSVESNLEELPK